MLGGRHERSVSLSPISRAERELFEQAEMLRRQGLEGKSEEGAGDWVVECGPSSPRPPMPEAGEELSQKVEDNTGGGNGKVGGGCGGSGGEKEGGRASSSAEKLGRSRLMNKRNFPAFAVAASASSSSASGPVEELRDALAELADRDETATPRGATGEGGLLMSNVRSWAAAVDDREGEDGQEEEEEEEEEEEAGGAPGSGGRTQRSEAETLGGHWESVNFLLDEVECLRADRARLEVALSRAESEAVSLRLAGCDPSKMMVQARGLCQQLASEREERIRCMEALRQLTDMKKGGGGSEEGARKWKDGLERAEAAARGVMSRWEASLESAEAGAGAGAGAAALGGLPGSLLDDGGLAAAVEARERLQGRVRELEREAAREAAARGRAEAELKGVQERCREWEQECGKAKAIASEMSKKLNELPTVENLRKEREAASRFEAELEGELGEMRRLQRAADAARERAEHALEEAAAVEASLRRENAALGLAVHDEEANVDEYLSLRASVAALNASLETYQASVEQLEEELREEREISSALETLVKQQQSQLVEAEAWRGHVISLPGPGEEKAQGDAIGAAVCGNDSGDFDGGGRQRGAIGGLQRRVRELEGWMTAMELELASSRLEADSARRALRECEALAALFKAGRESGGDAAIAAAASISRFVDKDDVNGESGEEGVCKKGGGGMTGKGGAKVRRLEATVWHLEEQLRAFKSAAADERDEGAKAMQDYELRDAPLPEDVGDVRDVGDVGFDHRGGTQGGSSRALGGLDQQQQQQQKVGGGGVVFEAASSAKPVASNCAAASSRGVVCGEGAEWDWQEVSISGSSVASGGPYGDGGEQECEGMFADSVEGDGQKNVSAQSQLYVEREWAKRREEELLSRVRELERSLNSARQATSPALPTPPLVKGGGATSKEHQEPKSTGTAGTTLSSTSSLGRWGLSVDVSEASECGSAPPSQPSSNLVAVQETSSASPFQSASARSGVAIDGPSPVFVASKEEGADKASARLSEAEEKVEILRQSLSAKRAEIASMQQALFAAEAGRQDAERTAVELRVQFGAAVAAKERLELEVDMITKRCVASEEQLHESDELSLGLSTEVVRLQEMCERWEKIAEEEGGAIDCIEQVFDQMVEVIDRLELGRLHVEGGRRRDTADGLAHGSAMAGSAMAESCMVTRGASGLSALDPDDLQERGSESCGSSISGPDAVDALYVEREWGKRRVEELLGRVHELEQSLSASSNGGAHASIDACDAERDDAGGGEDEIRGSAGDDEFSEYGDTPPGTPPLTSDIMSVQDLGGDGRDESGGNGPLSSSLPKDLGGGEQEGPTRQAILDDSTRSLSSRGVSAAPGAETDNSHGKMQSATVRADAEWLSAEVDRVRCREADLEAVVEELKKEVSEARRKEVTLEDEASGLQDQLQRMSKRLSDEEERARERQMWLGRERDEALCVRDALQVELTRMMDRLRGLEAEMQVERAGLKRSEEAAGACGQALAVVLSELDRVRNKAEGRLAEFASESSEAMKLVEVERAARAALEERLDAAIAGKVRTEERAGEERAKMKGDFAKMCALKATSETMAAGERARLEDEVSKVMAMKLAGEARQEERIAGAVTATFRLRDRHSSLAAFTALAHAAWDARERREAAEGVWRRRRKMDMSRVMEVWEMGIAMRRLQEEHEAVEKRLEGERDAMEASVVFSSREREALEATVSGLIKEKEGCEKERETLEATVSGLIKEKEGCEKERDALEATVSGLIKEREGCEKEREALEATASGLIKEREDFEKEREGAMKKLDLVEEERCALEGELECMKDEAELLRREVGEMGELHEQLERHWARDEEREAEVKMLQGKVCDLEAELARAREGQHGQMSLAGHVIEGLREDLVRAKHAASKRRAISANVKK